MISGRCLTGLALPCLALLTSIAGCGRTSPTPPPVPVVERKPDLPAISLKEGPAFPLPAHVESKDIGPGTVIKQELAKFGIVADKGCACKDLARKMDADGPDKVETNIDNYVNKMRESIKSWKGKIPVPTPPDFVIRQLILHAVKRSRKFNGE